MDERDRQEKGPARAADERGAEGAREAPVISLDEFRRQVKERAARAQQGDRRVVQALALIDAMAQGRMDEGDVDIMVLLGIVTNDADLFPCDSMDRDEDTWDWLTAYNEAREQLAEDKQAELPRPEHAMCPLSCMMDWNDDQDSPKPPCARALRDEYGMKLDRYNRLPHLLKKPELDESDPILVNDVHPCMVLGNLAHLQLMTLFYESHPKE